jgi:AraC family transcriptional regulator, regulatory protein of adaptative response / methylated-DNA-[protein]-cysteine methyltransferase
VKFIKKTNNNNNHKVFKLSQFNTKLGSMIAIGDEDRLYLLKFADKANLEYEVEKFKIKLEADVVSGNSTPITSIKSELECYFDGTLTKFETPIHLVGSSFQKLVWKMLSNVLYSQTKSYLEQAELIGKRAACRAVGNANGANRLAIIVPCHRIINSNGNIGGYGGGCMRKEWLIDHERRYRDEACV